MKYELAKELKDAGFEQHFTIGDVMDIWLTGEGHSWTRNSHHEIREDMDKDIACRVVPLSELIEACGEDLSHIKRYPVDDEVYWWAVSHTTDYPKGHALEGNNIEEQGKNPEEAVAKLWLALNK